MATDSDRSLDAPPTVPTQHPRRTGGPLRIIEIRGSSSERRKAVELLLDTIQVRTRVASSSSICICWWSFACIESLSEFTLKKRTKHVFQHMDSLGLHVGSLDLDYFFANIAVGCFGGQLKKPRAGRSLPLEPLMHMQAEGFLVGLSHLGEFTDHTLHNPAKKGQPSDSIDGEGKMVRG